jgi:hypothetical protein
MKNISLSTIISLFWVNISLAQFNYNTLKVDYESAERSESNPNGLTFQKLRLYPIRAQASFLAQNRNMDYYMSLQEAINNRKIQITESSRSGTVNNLIVRNLSNDTIFVMSGEILEGGKQDRVVADDMLIPPGGGKRNLAVFCVERKRWAYKGEANTEFKEYEGMANEHLRKVIDKSHNQSDVWKEVQHSNEVDHIQSYTEAYTDHLKSQEFRQQERGYLDFFAYQFDNQQDVVGVVAVSGDRVIGCDIFASQKLFLREYPKLLYAYIDEAVAYGDWVKINRNTVEKYMDNLLSSESSQKRMIKEQGKIFQVGQRVIHISSY